MGGSGRLTSPVVVKGSSFTVRVPGSLVDAILAALAEGIDPASIEGGVVEAGYPATVLHPLQEFLARGPAPAARARRPTCATGVPYANLGSILGAGFPAWTGGVVRFVDRYAGGAAGFVERARQLAAHSVDRFLPPQSLVETARAGGPVTERLAAR